jgi:hypothetical protein
MTKIIGINYKTTTGDLPTFCGNYAPSSLQICTKSAELQLK